MSTIAVRTTLHAEPDTVFDVLADFEGYPTYTEHLTDARAVEEGGNGTEGTVYEMDFAWWKLGYTARSRVTDLERPDHIAWELVGGPAASGIWRVEAVDAPVANVDTASEVVFAARYDPDSVTGSEIGLPVFVSLEWVLEKATPLVQEEAVRVVQRVAQDVEGHRSDVEGKRRDVDVRIESGPAAAEHLPEGT